MKIEDYKVGDKVKVLAGYNFTDGEVIGIGRKKIKVKVYSYGFFVDNIQSFHLDKLAHEDEKVVVVCRTNEKSRSGQYYVDRAIYPQFHLQAKYIPRQCWIYEHLGGLHSSPKDYFSKISNTNIPQWVKDEIKNTTGYKL